MALVSALIVTVATVGAYVVSASGPKVYGARSEVVVEVADEVRVGDADRLIGTQMVVLKSRDVLGPAAEANGVDVDALADALEVSRVSTSDVLRLTVTDRDRDQALRMVSAVTARFIEVSADSSIDEATREFLDARIAELSTRQNQIAQVLGQPPDVAPTDRGQLQLESQNLVQELADLRNRVTGLELEATGRGRARVVTTAYVLADPVKPQPSQAAALGLLVGLAVAGSIWIGLAQLRREK